MSSRRKRPITRGYTNRGEASRRALIKLGEIALDIAEKPIRTIRTNLTNFKRNVLIPALKSDSEYSDIEKTEVMDRYQEVVEMMLEVKTRLSDPDTINKITQLIDKAKEEKTGNNEKSWKQQLMALPSEYKKTTSLISTGIVAGAKASDYAEEYLVVPVAEYCDMYMDRIVCRVYGTVDKILVGLGKPIRNLGMLFGAIIVALGVLLVLNAALKKMRRGYFGFGEAVGYRRQPSRRKTSRRKSRQKNSRRRGKSPCNARPRRSRRKSRRPRRSR